MAVAIETHRKCLIGMGPAAPGLGERDMTVVHNTRYLFLTLTQPDHVFFFVFFRLEKSFTWPKRERYTDGDAEALAASVADHPIAPSMVFGEMWEKRYRGSLISIEGVLEHWHHGRIVLAGDSVHKVRSHLCISTSQTTPNQNIDKFAIRSRPTLPWEEIHPWSQSWLSVIIFNR